MSWLTNVVDRASVQFTCRAGSFLYQEDLATHLKALFADVVDPTQDATNDDTIALTDEE